MGLDVLVLFGERVMNMDISVSGNKQIPHTAAKDSVDVGSNIIINKDSLAALKELPDECVDCCVTSPPYYGLRDYGMEGQIGREATPEQYVARLAEVFGQLYRVLSNSGTLWLNIADSYCGTGSKGVCHEAEKQKGGNGQKTSLTQNIKGCKNKDMIGIPWMVAFALRDSGWYLRSDIIWQKGNAMPENVRDRPTRSYEHVFLFSKSKRYYYDASAIAEPIAPSTAERYIRGRSDSNKYAYAVPGQGNGKVQGINRPRKAGEIKKEDISPYRNSRDVWMINTVAYRGAHFAAFPPKLALKCILAGCPEDGIVIDPFFGSGTTGLVATENNRRYIGIDLNPVYCTLAAERIGGVLIEH